MGLDFSDWTPRDPLNLILPPGQERIGSFSARDPEGDSWLVDWRHAPSTEQLSRQDLFDFQSSEETLRKRLPWKNPKQKLMIIYSVPGLDTPRRGRDVPERFLMSSCYKRVLHAYLPGNAALAQPSALRTPSDNELQAGSAIPRDGAQLPPAAGRQGEGGRRLLGRERTARPGKPLVSVVTVTFQRAWSLERAIQSVVNQTYENVEHIIVDGGSTDETLALLQNYDQSIDYWVSEPDTGISQAENKALRVASGEWLFFLNSDDVFADPEVLESVFLSPGDFSRYDIILGQVFYDHGRCFVSNLGPQMLFRNSIHHQGVFYKQSLFSTFRYDEHLRMNADYELNLTLFRLGRTAIGINRVISIYDSGGVSDKGRWEGYGVEIRIRRKHLGTCRSMPFDFVTLLKFLYKRVKRWLIT